MCPDDRDQDATEAQLESLVAAAEKTRSNRKTDRKPLNIEDAENTLNSLLDAVDETGRAAGRSQDTQTAMETLFTDYQESPAGGPGVLVGLEDLGGVEGSIDESMDEEPTIAGAEDARKITKPVRKLDDGIDFWNELETMDRDPDEEL